MSLVILKTFPDRMSAEIARGVLEANGIAAFVQADDEGGLHPGMALASNVRLMVNEADAEWANDVLAD